MSGQVMPVRQTWLALSSCSGAASPHDVPAGRQDVNIVPAQEGLDRLLDLMQTEASCLGDLPVSCNAWATEGGIDRTFEVRKPVGAVRRDSHPSHTSFCRRTEKRSCRASRKD